MSSASIPIHLRPVHPLLVLTAFVAVTWGVALLSGLASPDGWYDTLRKPTWNPPGWVFGPVWMTLYTLMAVAAWLVWRQGGWRAGREGARAALVMYFVQLALNGLWSPLFFAMHRIDLALIDIIILWIAIIVTTVLFFRHRALAGWLMVPYLAWVTFAAAINFEIWRLNPV